jgi:tripartite ATP-independent transporter DctM subunit
VALPELRRSGYAGGFATATLAAGGTLGILIPPSVILVIYAILTEQNIAKLFAAAIIPGLLAALGYMLTIAIYVRLYPDQAGTQDRLPLRDRLQALLPVWPVLLVFGLVVGGIYNGWFTPTEGAAVGAAGTGVIALVSGRLGLGALRDSLMQTATGTGMIFFIVLGAAFYNGFLALTQVPQELSTWVAGQGFSPMMIMVMILVFYLILGCLMDSLSMILLTVPIFWPVISTLDFGMTPDHLAIWFGILVLIVVEVGLITPPVGMNLFIINSMDRTTKITATYRAVLCFVASDIIRVVILLMFPIITLILI